MKNYTTQTAALKATTVDTRLLDAKRIDTQKLYVNGVSIDELQSGGGESGSVQYFRDYIYMIGFENGEVGGSARIPADKLDEFMNPDSTESIEGVEFDVADFFGGDLWVSITSHDMNAAIHNTYDVRMTPNNQTI
jgi:hypothetical protein